MFSLDPNQLSAVKRMHNGCILRGDVGSGKSITGLAYYYIRSGGPLWVLEAGQDVLEHLMPRPKDLYIITTARKRDSLEWEEELARFGLSTEPGGFYSNTVVVDSWNNVKKYDKIAGSFFIFDEDKVTGSGAWVRSFQRIAMWNEWIILSATPGDTWIDYCPVFVANGFYRNKTDFCDQHVVYKRIQKFPVIVKYYDEGRLIRHKEQVLVEMECERHTERISKIVSVEYDIDTYRWAFKNRQNPETGEPFENISDFSAYIRRLVFSDPSRAEACREIVKEHPKVIIFYSYNYELEALKAVDWGEGVEVAEYNGSKHEPLPSGDKWVYLTQYLSSAEAWNCTETDTVIFYSQNYSYRIMEQCAGRIDRRSTPYKYLYYYILRSFSPLDLRITRALKGKKKFNDKDYFSLED